VFKPTLQQPSITASLGIALTLRFPKHYAALCQRLVVLPDTDGQRAWLVDLHDPFRPTAHGFPSMAAAEAAWREQVYRALCAFATEAAAELVA
jgi:hypothetical protein